MPPIDAPLAPRLCVAIHDVAPATWPDCLRLLQAVRAVADIPLTWLVVPHFHGSPLRCAGFERALDGLLAQGHELVLHGYTHEDDGPPPASLSALLLRRAWTQCEGEFAALDGGEARRRLDLGLAWFARRGWPVHGFVAPAWLAGPATWTALRSLPFEYTTTLSRLHLLPEGRAVWAPSLVYATRNGAGRCLSPPFAELGGWVLRPAPVLRLALHPHDARHPMLLRHAQHLLAHLLRQRRACTKRAAALSLRARYQ